MGIFVGLEIRRSFVCCLKVLSLILGITLAALMPSISHADNEGDDAYDPFADYSEFDENNDEEADINFFRHGRFVTMGFAMGYRGFTDKLNDLYTPAPTYGLFLGYFFDLRSAVQLSFLTGDHGFEVNALGDKVTGNIAFTLINLDYKYYMNTQNITRGLADLNPYVFGGLAQVYRTKSIPGDLSDGKESTMGLNLGGGVEIPLNRKKSFFALQLTYRMYNFKDENNRIYMPTAGGYSNIKPSGDSYDLLGILGLNF